MNEIENAYQLLNFSRNFFKGSLKSTNKTFSLDYGNAPPPRKQKRIENCGKGDDVLEFVRCWGEASRLESLLTLDPGLRVGNCCEYTLMALKHGVDLHIPNIWYAKTEMHIFILLAERLHVSEMILNDFPYCTDSSVCVCDPWFNLSCEMRDFPMMLMAKANKWEMEGKEIYVGQFTERAIPWTQKLLQCNTSFHSMTDSEGKWSEYCSRLVKGS